MKDQNRILARTGARELTIDEVEFINAAAHTNSCSIATATATHTGPGDGDACGDTDSDLSFV